VVLVPPFGTKFTPTVWRPPRGRIHNYTVTKRQHSPAHEDEGLFVPRDEVQAVTVAHFVPRKRVQRLPSEVTDRSTRTI
jgi:hypothetical protein